MPQIFPYDPAPGAVYARSYAISDTVPPETRLFYHDPGDDCTNFISQCVWAAYGGWIPGFSPELVAENARRIREDVRQVSGLWYGSAWHIGSTRWCRVVEFYDFVTGRANPLGPRAQLTAEGDWSSVDPAAVRAGDVIQLVVATYTAQRYGHGLYVTQAGGAWENTLVCCHSIDRLDTPLAAFAAYPDVYRRLRVLRFGPAAFGS